MTGDDFKALIIPPGAWWSPLDHGEEAPLHTLRDQPRAVFDPCRLRKDTEGEADGDAGERAGEP